MASSSTKGLALGAALFGGLQAGVTANRAFVLLPAWERLGVIPWANFTRAENVGIGALFYPVLGLAALLFTVSAALAFRLDRTARGSRRFPIHAAALLAIVWATVTRALIPGDVRFAGRGHQCRSTPANISDRLPLVGSQRRPSRPHVRPQSVGARRHFLQP